MAPQYIPYGNVSSPTPHDPQYTTSFLEVLAVAAMIGSLACLLYIIIHIGFTNIYKTMKKIIGNGTDEDPDEEPRISPTEQTKSLLAEQHKREKRKKEEKNIRTEQLERAENNVKQTQPIGNNDNFDEVLQKASDALGHSKLKSRRWIREQKKMGEDKYNQTEKEKNAKKREQREGQLKSGFQQTESAKQDGSYLEDRVAECCKKSEEARVKASNWAYGTMESAVERVSLLSDNKNEAKNTNSK